MPKGRGRWRTFRRGREIGERGSEQGIIRYDWEHPSGTRLTIEEAGHTPWSITCGVYGCLVHTVFFDTESEAKSAARRMKPELVHIAELQAKFFRTAKVRRRWQPIADACKALVTRW